MAKRAGGAAGFPRHLAHDRVLLGAALELLCHSENARGAGFGECTGVRSVTDVKKHGRVQERSHFRKGATSARSRALAQLEELERDESGRLLLLPADDDGEVGTWEHTDDYFEIPHSFCRPSITS